MTEPTLQQLITVDDLLDFADCEHCGGDGGFDEPAAWSPTTIRCEPCNGTGQVVREYQVAGQDRFDEVPPA
jgi:hypothetical protein